MTSKKKTIIASIVSFILVISIVSGCGIAIINAINNKNAQSGDVLGSMTKVEGKTVNILLLGTDESRRRTDTMMLFSLDTEENKLTITSIPRDTKIKIKNRAQKLNASIPFGSLGLLIQNIKDMTGIPIHHYALVDFTGFRNIIDILGGVEFDVPMRMKYSDPTQDLYIDLEKGVQILDGKKAEQVVRYRYGYAMGDYKRIEVQRDFMIALMEQKFKPEYLSKAVDIFKEISKYAETNITVGDMMNYLSSIKKLNMEEINNVKMPGQSRYINRTSYFIADIEGVKEEFCTLFGGDPENVKEEVYGYTDIDYGKGQDDSSDKDDDKDDEPKKDPEDENPSKDPIDNKEEEPKEDDPTPPEDEPIEEPEKPVEDPEEPKEDEPTPPEEETEPEPEPEPDPDPDTTNE
ncbi:MAG: LCP family protein [Clostridia bacterium]|nr:LCP family protein [Clostridia bacterium]